MKLYEKIASTIYKYIQKLECIPAMPKFIIKYCEGINTSRKN